MLDYLRIRGLALLDDVALDFDRGMNVLTGETGAGKSIIVDALTLVRGVRGRAELVREGDRAARIEAQFGLDADRDQGLIRALVDHGIEDPADEGLIVERVVSRSGRGRCVVQGNLTTLAVLSQVGEHLIDICSQHEHHSLTKPGRHLELLDAYAENGSRLEEYGSRYQELVELRRARHEIEEKASQGSQRADYLRFQIDELGRVSPEAGERDALAARVQLMRQAHHWQSFSHEARQVLYEADDAVAGRLAALLEAARRGAADSAVLAELEEQLESARIACEEAADAASRLAEEVDLEPEALEQCEDRLHELDRLQRKHGCDCDDLPGRLEAMQAELAALENLDDHRSALDDRERELRQSCLALAKKLGAQRRRAAVRLGAAVQAELAALHMPDARLEVQVQSLSADDLGPRGMDRVEFVFSANPGEPVAPFSRVASGGELSRVLLAIKGVLATGDQVATYVFDEVDAGVGGAVAEAIGRRLSDAARERQVLCITHLPQIAAFADAHYRVEKRREGERTVTRVVALTPEQRVEELARMLGGARVSASARQHAQQLLSQARRGRGRPRKSAARISARR